MVRQFDLPWQPVAKRKQKESFEEMSKDQSFTSPNYYQSFENNEDKNKRSWLARGVQYPDGNKPLTGLEEDHERANQTKNRKKLQNLIDDISKTLSSQKI